MVFENFINIFIGYVITTLNAPRQFEVTPPPDAKGKPTLRIILFFSCSGEGNVVAFGSRNDVTNLSAQENDIYQTTKQVPKLNKITNNIAI